MVPTLLTAFLIGLLGSTHCLGMCGGIVGALNAGAAQTERSTSGRLVFNAAYNFGRLTSYAIAGMLVALVGSFLSHAAISTVVPVGRLLAALVMIMLGLYLFGWTRPIMFLEKAGYFLWRRIEPLGRRLLPAKTPWQAFGLGLVWGWLPCGLVYSALVLCVTSPTPLGGALIMASFGLGTLPMLLAMGTAVDVLRQQVRKPMVRNATASAIILLGVYTIATAFGDHHHGHANAGKPSDMTNQLSSIHKAARL